MTINELIEKIKNQPGNVNFTEVIETIENTYHYSPKRFSNGTGNNAIINEAGTNEGSCKIFAFAKLHKLDKKQTLACFGKYYRDDVLSHPDNTDHANIRNFMNYGWEGITVEGEALAIR